MNDTVVAPTIGQALAWAFQRLGEEWRILIIFVAVYLLFSVIALFVTFDNISAMFELNAEISRLSQSGEITPEQMQRLQELPEITSAAFSPSFIIPYFVLTIIVLLSAIVLLSRLTDMDRTRLFEGGVKLLASRMLWVLWRLIGALGWSMLIMVVFAVILMIFGSLLSGIMVAVQSGDFGPAIAVGVIFYGFMLAALLPVQVSLAISIYGASRDIRMGILATWKHLRGARGRAVAAQLVLFLGFIMVMIPFAFLNLAVTQTQNLSILVILSVPLTAVNVAFYFLWLAVGATFAPYALRDRLHREDDSS